MIIVITIMIIMIMIIMIIIIIMFPPRPVRGPWVPLRALRRSGPPGALRASWGLEALGLLGR